MSPIFFLPLNSVLKNCSPVIPAKKIATPKWATFIPIPIFEIYKKILPIFVIFNIVSFILTKKSLITPTNNQNDSVPHIIANIDEPLIVDKLKAAIRDVSVSRAIIFNKFFDLPFPQFKKGAIAFESDEIKFELDEQGKPIGMFVKERKDAHMLIEDFMLLANKKVAEFDVNSIREVIKTFSQSNTQASQTQEAKSMVQSILSQCDIFQNLQTNLFDATGKTEIKNVLELILLCCFFKNRSLVAYEKRALN